jgi:hypothetical protein
MCQNMTKTIYEMRLLLGADNSVNIAVPQRASILSLGMRHGALHAWVLADTGRPHDQVWTLRVFCAGQPIPGEIGPYLGSYEHWEDMFHVFHATRIVIPA